MAGIRRKRTPKKEFRGELDPTIEELEKLYGDKGNGNETQRQGDTDDHNHMCLRHSEI